MMQILKAAGLDIITDKRRVADQSNAKGYYEHEGVKALARHNTECLNGAQGKAIKIVSTLLKHLPNEKDYKVIFMRREIDEILASQAMMLESQGQLSNAKVDENELKALYLKHLEKTSKYLNRANNIDIIDISYSDALLSPRSTVANITKFLNMNLNEQAMKNAVDTRMQHQKTQ